MAFMRSSDRIHCLCSRATLGCAWKGAQKPMTKNPLFAVTLLAVVILGGVSVQADVTTRGQVEGRVLARDGTPLPGAIVTLSGAPLISGAVVETSGNDGRFRFVNLNPGRYEMRVELDGFAANRTEITVHVGRTVTINPTLELGSVAETMTVTASAPLIDQTSAAHGTNMTAEELQELPTDRDFSSIVDAAAGFNNQAAYGAGGNVAGYDPFGYGAATNSYQLNGVSISNLEYGNSWVNPNYDTIQEIQIVGPGGSAEYSSYSGAVVNVVTKAGTSELGGSVSGFYTNEDLTGDNSDGIADLEPGTIDHDWEISTTLGGPIVPEKLHFFGAFGYIDSSTAPPSSPFYDELDRQQYQLRLDLLPSDRHIVAAMINREPIDLGNLGLQAGSGPEIGYFREQDTTSGFVSWLGSWSDDLITEVRYAGVDGFHDRIPNSLEKAQVTDLATGRVYNSSGIVREQENDRSEARGVITYYTDEFLGADHEMKAGLEYENAKTTTLLSTAEDALYSLIPLGGGLTYVQAIVGYNVNQSNELDRTGAFIQDRATFGRATVTAGLRYDDSKTTDVNTGATMLSFDHFSPRLGFTWDFSGEGRSVVRLGAGRYYDKIPTYGIGSYAGTGLAPVGIYGYLSDQPLDPTDTALLRELSVQPENLLLELTSELFPVESDIGAPHADVFNIGFDQQLGRNYALSLNYVYRENDDFIVVTQRGDIEYAPVEVTSEFTGRTFTIYQVAGGGPDDFAVGNRDFNYQKTHFAVIELRGRPRSDLYVNASLAFEDTSGTRDNNECAILSLCSVGTDGNPNFEQNPFFTEGSLSQERPWMFKVRGNWELPGMVNFGWDVRWMAGRPYGAVDYCFNIPECNDPYLFEVPLEPKDARSEDEILQLNLRVAKAFVFRNVQTIVSLDGLNLTNEPIDWTTYSLNTNINDVYPLESTEAGDVVSAFGLPGEAGSPRQFRLGVRLLF